MKMIVPVSVLAVAVAGSLVFAQVANDHTQASQPPYDYRVTAAYKKLSATQQRDLAQVRRDFAQLWGALDMYADAHDDRPPSKLDELVPAYLPDLPHDPFAADGSGYRYRPGSPGNRAWVISSVGLADFPFLAQRGNVGLYVCKGEWISGINPGAVAPR